jgi:hypothetical protein
MLIVVQIIGIAEGTVYLHSLAITHGDIKPVHNMTTMKTQLVSLTTA